MATIARLSVVLGLDKDQYDKGMKDAEVTAARTMGAARVSVLGLTSAFTAVVGGITIATGALGKFAQRGSRSLAEMGVDGRNAGHAFEGLAITLNQAVDAAARRVAGSESLMHWFDGLAGGIAAAAYEAGRFLDRTAQIQKQIDVFHGIGPMFEGSGSELYRGTPGGGEAAPTDRSAEMEAFRASLQAVREEGELALQEWDNLNSMIEVMTGSLSEIRVGEINPLTGELLDFGDASHLLGVQFIPEMDMAMEHAKTSAGLLREIIAGLNDELSDTEKFSRGAAHGLSGLGSLGQIFGFSIPGVSQLFGGLGLFNSITGISDLFGGGKASGGPVSAGTAYMVGEEGREMFVPQTNGTIIPNGGVTINVPAARDPISFARDQDWQRAIAETFRELESGGFRAVGT